MTTPPEEPTTPPAGGYPPPGGQQPPAPGATPGPGAYPPPAGATAPPTQPIPPQGAYAPPGGGFPGGAYPGPAYGTPPPKKSNKGLIIGVAVALVVGLGLAAGTLVLSNNSDDDSSSGPRVPETTADTEDVNVFDLKVGDCLGGQFEEGEVQEAQTVDCADPHALEIYSSFDIPTGPYPGEDSVIQSAQDGCLRDFNDFIGLSYDDSELELTYYYPLEDAWPQDREVLCVVVSPVLVQGTLEGAQR